MKGKILKWISFVCISCVIFVMLSIYVSATCSHSFNGSYTTIKEPTCTTNGTKVGRCTKCSAVLTTYSIPATGHNWRDTSCTTKTCTVCKATSSKTPTHTFNGSYTVTKQPTCTTNGTKVGRCTKCSAIVSTYSIPATGHNWRDTSCTTKTCTVCKATSSKTPTHTFNGSYTVTKQPTCTTNGTKVGRCIKCSAIVSTYSIPATGHNWSEATCTSPKTCTVCKATSGSALGHTFNGSYTVTKAPTCTTDGTKVGRCTKCSAIVSTYSIPATGHNWSEATCTSPKTCTVCKATEGKKVSYSVYCGFGDKKYTVADIYSDKYFEFGNSGYPAAFLTGNASQYLLTYVKYNYEPVYGYYINICTDSDWTISADVSWIHFGSINGQGSNKKLISAGDNYIFLYADPYMGMHNESRKATITATNMYSNEKINYTVYQSGVDTINWMSKTKFIDSLKNAGVYDYINKEDLAYFTGDAITDGRGTNGIVYSQSKQNQTKNYAVQTFADSGTIKCNYIFFSAGNTKESEEPAFRHVYMEVDAVNNMQIEPSGSNTIGISGIVAVDRKKISSTDIDAARRQRIVDSLGVVKTVVDCGVTVIGVEMPYAAAVTYSVSDAALSDSIEKWYVNDKSNSADLIALDYGMAITLSNGSGNKNVLEKQDQRLQLDYWTYGDIQVNWNFKIQTTKIGDIQTYIYNYNCPAISFNKKLCIDKDGNIK